MSDRNVQYPNRYKITKVEGTDDIYDFTPVPGTISEEGTLVNTSTLLKDVTAGLYGFTSEQIRDVVPDDVLAILSNAILNVEDGYTDVNGIAVPQVKIETISYTGTGTGGSDAPNTLYVPEWAKIVVISGITSTPSACGMVILVKPPTDASGSFGRMGIGGAGAYNSNYPIYFYGTWAGNNLSWYSPFTNAHIDQMNIANTQYIAYCIGWLTKEVL